MVTPNFEVADARRLARYLKKRAEWLSWYNVSTDEPNSILSQLHIMLLSEISYRCLREERDAFPDERISKPIISYLLDSGYFSTQLTAIRKLLDGRRDVISLQRAVVDVTRCRELITREIYVSYDGTPYQADLPSHTVNGRQGVDSPFSLWSKSNQRHLRFDRLSGVGSSVRSRNDFIAKKKFDKLRLWLDDSGANDLIELCNKFLAHAASSQSRGSVIQSGISFSQVEMVQKTLVRVSRALYDIVLYCGVSSPVMPMTPLGYFGRVWVGNDLDEEVKRLNDRWDLLEANRNAWPATLEDDFLE